MHSVQEGIGVTKNVATASRGDQTGTQPWRSLDVIKEKAVIKDKH